MNLRQGLGLAAMSLALAASSVGAFAEGPGVIATAPSGAGAPSPAVAIGAPVKDATGVQIDAWVADDGVAQPNFDGPAPRTVHGEISAGVGSNGYRNVSGVADIPIGQTGDVVVAASTTTGQFRGGRDGGYGYGGALGLGFYSSGAPGAASACNRQPWAQATAPASRTLSDCASAAAP